MPNVVIGRRGLDKFLFLESLKRELCVIDATEIIMGIHHTTDEGNNEKQCVVYFTQSTYQTK